MRVRGRQAFSDGCVGDWGGGDYRDLMSGLDHALAGEQLLIVSESDSTYCA
jgi:dipeptidyl aminopeptidase/acylaminoacyl peptidase